MTQKTKAAHRAHRLPGACLIPSAGCSCCPQGEAAANQTLAPAPRLFLEDGSFNTQVLDEVTDYVADHFAFRQEMITAGAALDAAVFHVSSEEDVVLGRGGLALLPGDPGRLPAHHPPERAAALRSGPHPGPAPGVRPEPGGPAVCHRGPQQGIPVSGVPAPCGNASGGGGRHRPAGPLSGGTGGVLHRPVYPLPGDR